MIFGLKSLGIAVRLAFFHFFFFIKESSINEISCPKTDFCRKMITFAHRFLCFSKQIYDVFMNPLIWLLVLSDNNDEKIFFFIKYYKCIKHFCKNKTMNIINKFNGFFKILLHFGKFFDSNITQ